MKWQPVIVFTPINGKTKVMKYQVVFESKKDALRQGQKYLQEMAGIFGNGSVQAVPMKGGFFDEKIS
jgi:hypothetical protein